MNAQAKSDNARRILRALYAKRAPWGAVRRAERLNAFVAKHMALKAGDAA